MYCSIWILVSFWAHVKFLRIESYWFNVNHLSNHGQTVVGKFWLWSIKITIFNIKMQIV